MSTNTATITGVKTGGKASGRYHSKFRHMFFAEIEFRVGDVVCKKDITDPLSLRFKGGIPIDFIESYLPILLKKAEFYVRSGSGVQAYVPEGRLYNFIYTEVYKKWKKSKRKKIKEAPVQ